MGRETIGLCDLYHFVESGLLPDGAAADIGGLLDTDHRLRRLVTAARMECGAKSVGRKLSVGPRQRHDLETAQRSVRAAFAGDDMRGLMRQDLVARPAMDQCRRDIARGPGGHEHGGLLSKQISAPPAQPSHGASVAAALV